MTIRQWLRFRRLRARAVNDAMAGGYRVSPAVYSMISVQARAAVLRGQGGRLGLAELLADVDGNDARVKPSVRALAARDAWLAAQGGELAVKRRMILGPWADYHSSP